MSEPIEVTVCDCPGCDAEATDDGLCAVHALYRAEIEASEREERHRLANLPDRWGQR